MLLYLKKSGLDKQGKATIMGRITLNRSNLFACQSKNSMAHFSCKLSCNPKLWNPRSGRLEGKSKEAVETNAKIECILLFVNSAVDNLIKRNVDFTATTVKEMNKLVLMVHKVTELTDEYQKRDIEKWGNNSKM
jgi:hypothetical protein